MTNILLLDGNSLINRAFYALPPLTSVDGLPTNAVHGFMSMLLKLQKDYKPDYWVVVFDKSKPTIRIDQYAGYKAQRKETPETLRPQFDYLKNILQAMSVPILELAGYEADDIIATVRDRAETQGIEVLIFTGDRDALQLVSPLTRVYLTIKGISDVDCYTDDKLQERYGLNPRQIVDLKGLMGDASDNIPGIPGVGEKTALKLLHEYGSVENVLAQKDKVTGNKLKTLLLQYEDQAILSKKLATMIHDVPLDFSLDQLKRTEPDYKMAIAALRQYGLFKVANLYEQTRQHRAVHTEESLNPPYPSNPSELLQSVTEHELEGSQWLSKIDEWVDQKTTLAITYRYQGNIHHGTWTEMGIRSPEEVYVLSRINQPLAVIDRWHELLQDSNVRKIVGDCKSLHSLLLNEGVVLEGLDLDLVLAAYLLNSNQTSYGMTDLLNESKEAMASMSLGKEAYMLHTLVEKYRENLAQEGLESLLHVIEEPLSLVLAQMEKIGIAIDREQLQSYGKEIEKKVARLENEVCELAGNKFNINSPQQLGKILFEDLSLPPMKKTKTGYSTDADTLEELRSEHPIIEKVLEYRQLVKLNSTYVKGLLSQIHEGKIHTTYQQTVATTGRLSSVEPNLQNIPIRLEEGRVLRKVFKPTKSGWLLLSADYSQIELRILAHYSKDPILCGSFLTGEDVHTRTASEVFGVSLDEVDSDMRRKAKAVNFGLMYGLTEFGLARDLSIPRKEAKFYITQYFERYSGVQHYLEEAVLIAKEKGEVRTLLNRLRKVPELNHANRMTRQFGERIAKNTPIQGTAADIMKIAMIRVAEGLEGLEADILLQVHDELLVQVAPQCIEKVTAIVKDRMENAYPITVPIVVDCKVGENWYDMTAYEAKPL